MKTASMMKISAAPFGDATVFIFGMGATVFGARCRSADDAHALRASNRYTDEVRAREWVYLQNGIHSVPAIIINERYVIQGGQPVEVFEQALRQIASQAG